MGRSVNVPLGVYQSSLRTSNTLIFPPTLYLHSSRFIKASEARLVVEFFAIGTGAQGYRLLTR